MESLEEKTTRRNLLKSVLGVGATVFSFSGFEKITKAMGIPPSDANTNYLPTNVAKDTKEGKINVSEDKINLLVTEILHNLYYVIPLNEEKKVLFGGEPSFALIPKQESAKYEHDVGVPGGRIEVDGHWYFPYALAYEQNIQKLIPANKTPQKIIIKTNHNIREFPKHKKDGNINIWVETREDYPFEDETLIQNGAKYVVNEIVERQKESLEKFGKNLGFYATKEPFILITDEREQDKKVRIAGHTYVYAWKQGTTKEAYFKERGFYDPTRKEEKEPVKSEGEAEGVFSEATPNSTK